MTAVPVLYANMHVSFCCWPNLFALASIAVPPAHAPSPPPGTDVSAGWFMSVTQHPASAKNTWVLRYLGLCTPFQGWHVGDPSTNNNRHQHLLSSLEVNSGAGPLAVAVLLMMTVAADGLS